MFQFILGGCGTGKSTKIMNYIKSDLQKQKDVLLLVPEQFSFEAEKKLYDFLGAKLFNHFKTYSFATLSQKILQQSNIREDNYASEQGKLLFLYQALQQQKKELQILGRQGSADFLTQLQVLITKIRKAGVNAEQLYETAPAFSGRLSQKIQDIAKILTAYDKILENHGLCDSLTDLTEAAKIAIHRNFFTNNQIYIDEFDSFTGDQYKLLEVMANQAEDLIIAIRSDIMHENLSGIFDGGNQTVQQLKRLAPNNIQMQECKNYQRSKYQDLKLVAEQIPNQNQNIKSGVYQNHVHIFSALDTVSEIEYICATICNMLADDKNLSCRDIAITVKQPEIYMPLLERAMHRYHLPYDMAMKKSVLHTELITYFLNLLQILSHASWSTDMILRYLKNEFSGYDLELVSMLEHFCFTYGIDKQDWTKSFYEQGKEISNQIEQFGGENLENLRLELIHTLQDLKNQCNHANIREICNILYQHINQKNQNYQKIYENLDNLQQHEFIAVWNILSDTMDSIINVFDFENHEEINLKKLYDIFLLLLQNSHFSMPPQILDSIRIVDAQTARLNMPKIVFVCGVSDGVFPSDISEHHMFRQHELELLEKHNIKISRLLPELYSDELLIINKIFSAPSEHLYLTYPNINADHELSNCSVMIEEILRIFPKNSNILQMQENINPDYYAWSLESAYFHFVRNLNQDTSSIASLRQILEQDNIYNSKIKKLLETQTEQNIHISSEIMRKLIGEKLNLSASSIEKFYKCPFQYFCMYCLKLYMPEQVNFSAQNIGNLAHHCLEEILKKYDVKKFLALSESELKQEIHILSENFSKENFSDTVRHDGRFQLNYRMTNESILQLLKHMQEELREELQEQSEESKFIPVEFEKKIKPFSMKDGQIVCHGKIDRVDICEKGNLFRVIDYKTSEKSFLPERLADGLDLQMLIYLFILEEMKEYGNKIPSAVLYMPSGQPSNKYKERQENKEKSPEEILEDYYRMKGIFADKSSEYIEKKIKNASESVMKNNKNEIFYINSEQMENLKKHVYQKIYDMADKIYAGEIEPDPNLNNYKRDKTQKEDYSPCMFCQCKDFCGKAETDTHKLTTEERQKNLEIVFGKNTCLDTSECKKPKKSKKSEKGE